MSKNSVTRCLENSFERMAKQNEDSGSVLPPLQPQFNLRGAMSDEEIKRILRQLTADEILFILQVMRQKNDKKFDSFCPGWNYWAPATHSTPRRAQECLTDLLSNQQESYADEWYFRNYPPIWKSIIRSGLETIPPDQFLPLQRHWQTWLSDQNRYDELLSFRKCLQEGQMKKKFQKRERGRK